MERIIAGDTHNEELSQNKDNIEKKIVTTIIRDPDLEPERSRSSNDKSERSSTVKYESGHHFPRRL